MSGFRFNAQRVFLTYSSLPERFTPQVLLDRLSAKAEPYQYLISQEMHKEAVGNQFHLHAYLKFHEKLDTKDQGFFDVPYYSINRHPNIQSVKGRGEPVKLFRYIQKEPVRLLTNIEETRPSWLQLVEDYPNRGEFLYELMWKINRIDNYAGYKTLRDLYDHMHTNPTYNKWKKDQESMEVSRFG